MDGKMTKIKNTTDSKIWVTALNSSKSVHLTLNPFDSKEVRLQDITIVNVTRAEDYRPPLRQLIKEAHENTDFTEVL